MLTRSQQPPRGDTIERAYSAYFRHSTAYSPDQPSFGSVIEHDGKQYVTLRNSYRVLAVYRIQNSGYLRRLHDWPDALDIETATTLYEATPPLRLVK